MDENIDFDFVPASNARQEILPYQHEPEPDILRETDPESSESDSDEEQTDSERELEPPGRVGNTDW